MIRCATHAGSWYQDKDKVLSKELDEWLSDVTSVEYLDGEETRPPIANVRAIIAPHAGYSYSGRAAAFAYACVDTSNIERVFILGPSHHSYLTGCALTACSVYETPLGDLKVDQETIAELHENGRFDTMSLSVDEDEHSIEMHLPYIHKIMSRSRGEDFSIVPILVGATSPEKEKYYAEILLPYFLDPTNLFVISSDFCHYGSRFGFSPFSSSSSSSFSNSSTSSLITSTFRQTKSDNRSDHSKSESQTKSTPIWKQIEQLDQEAIQIIEDLDTKGFYKYLKQTKNTICGRHPIGVLLNILDLAKTELKNSSSVGSSDQVKVNGESSRSIQDKGNPKKRKAESDEGEKNETDQEAEAEEVKRNEDSDKQLFLKFTRYEQSSKCMKKTDSSVSYASAFVCLI